MPTRPYREKYTAGVRRIARHIKSDGCSKVRDWKKFCCLEHDVHYYYGRGLVLERTMGYWTIGEPITRGWADRQFYNCIRQRTAWWNPLRFSRWVGTRTLAWRAWQKHRKVRPN